MDKTAENETMEIVLTLILVSVIGIIIAVAGITVFKATVEPPGISPANAQVSIEATPPETPSVPVPASTTAATAPPKPIPTSTEAPAAAKETTATVPVAPVQNNDMSGVVAVIECVQDNGDGTYTAYFGYRNDLPKDVTIPVGSNNSFSGQANRGQPTVFQPGLHRSAVAVAFESHEVAWTLGTKTTSAFIGSAPCSLPPVAKFHAYPLMGKAPLQVTFSDDSSGSPTGWSWSFGTGDTSDEQNPTYLYKAPGTYAVTLNVKNPYGTNTITKTGFIQVTG